MEIDQPPYIPPPPPQHIPLNVQQLAKVHQLGTLTVAYTKASSKVFVGSSIIFILFFLLPLCSLQRYFSNPTIGPYLLLCLFEFVFAFAAIGFIFFSYRYRQVYLYMEGLVYCTWRNIGVLRWKEIEQLSWRTKGRVSLNVHKIDGTQITFKLTFPAQECTVIYDAIENEFARICAERSLEGSEEKDDSA
jgi:hypothetical protein